jgi:hypothetical protein
MFNKGEKMPRLHVPGVAESDGVVFKVAPAGTYAARIVSQEVKETSPMSKHPGSPMLKYSVKLLDEDVQGITVFDQIVLPSPNWMDEEQVRKSVARLNRLWKACGLDPEDDLDSEDLLNCELRVVIGLDSDDKFGERNTIKDTILD